MTAFIFKEVNNMLNKELGLMCKYFRKNALHLTLKQFSKLNNKPVSSISAFENGRSTNINFLQLYLVSCETQQEREIFLRLIRMVFNEVR